MTKARCLVPAQQHQSGRCSYYSIIAALEANLRIKYGFGDDLSIKYLRSKDDKVKAENILNKKIGRNVRILDIVKATGVPTDRAYKLFCQRSVQCAMHKIQGYTKYDVKKPLQIRTALERHLRKGPMIAVFFVSTNYNNCMKFGSIYVVDVNQAMLDKDEIAICHSVCVVSFGIEGRVPFLQFRTENLHWPTYGRVDIQSVIELYGIDV
uniref:Peptidase C1A papain C-terminal domain-containing protein n=1 Tax=Leersia perrieri TaxID=77586 RepID=A0A0D9WTT5_9ORYZ